MPRFITLLMLVGIAFAATACVVEPGPRGGGWCYWHPNACR